MSSCDYHHGHNVPALCGHLCLWTAARRKWPQGKQRRMNVVYACVWQGLPGKLCKSRVKPQGEQPFCKFHLPVEICLSSFALCNIFRGPHSQGQLDSLPWPVSITAPWTILELCRISFSFNGVNIFRPSAAPPTPFSSTLVSEVFSIQQTFTSVWH